MIIRELKCDELDVALELSWKVFKEYEAPDYSKQGVDEFYNILHDVDFIESLKVYGAFEQGKMIGTLAMRCEGNHIALFFVEGEFHRKGIGRKLFQKACEDNCTGKITVNSSPYAVEVYHHLGFVDTDTEQNVSGIRFTPMECIINKESNSFDQ